MKIIRSIIRRSATSPIVFPSCSEPHLAMSPLTVSQVQGLNRLTHTPRQSSRTGPVGPHPETIPSVVCSGLSGRRVGCASPGVSVRRATVMATGKEFDKNWLNANPLVLVLGFVGWVVPSSTPVPAYGGSSLTASFFASIGQELAHWPTGPSIDSDFW